MKEIGGYIEFETFLGKEYHSEAIPLNSARHCLAYLIEVFEIQRIWIPRYLCSSIREICQRYGIEVFYYEVNHDFTPNFDFTLQRDDYLFVVNYYGQISNSYIKELATKYPNLIIDNTQAFFQMPVEGVHTLYSCRKFFGVPDGGYLYTTKQLDKELPIDISYPRMNFLLARYETNASNHYHEYVANNDLFKNEPLKKMSKLTHNLLRGIDYELVQSKREENYKHLDSNLCSDNKLFVPPPQKIPGPYCYPLMIKNGQKLRQLLISQKIYVPLLWPNVREECAIGSIEYELSTNIVPIPCDQRYSKNEMEYVINIIQSHW